MISLLMIHLLIVNPKRRVVKEVKKEKGKKGKGKKK